MSYRFLLDLLAHPRRGLSLLSFLLCIEELSRRKGKSFLSAPAFLSLKALAATKAESRLAGLREQLSKLVTCFL
ncbi:hypothetical protein SLEP1_g58833 [Rubroshorea leprosula]|uniref:Uncharacterized protein n=1 Tax=Rubroshorea leprosula TaxID=152421 RepID=A0AAV5MT22_9ROSI|nr:hypothetical protein SLEP1_g58833 [Rubroshorea leprosula]